MSALSGVPRARRHRHRDHSGFGVRPHICPAATYMALQGLEQDGAIALHLPRLDAIREEFAIWCATEGHRLVTLQPQGHPIRAADRFEPPVNWRQIVRDVGLRT